MSAWGLSDPLVGLIRCAQMRVRLAVRVGRPHKGASPPLPRGGEALSRVLSRCRRMPERAGGKTKVSVVPATSSAPHATHFVPNINQIASKPFNGGAVDLLVMMIVTYSGGT